MLRIIEKDAAGRELATYIESKSNNTSNDTSADKDSIPGSTRIDRIPYSLPTKTSVPYIQAITDYLTDAFLPSGYPHTLSPDYTSYQIYDSLQAFASSIAGLLSSRAVLEGVGVGDASASPTAALLLSVLQDSLGRFATILFAQRFGSALEPECKMWRLAADVFNDTAMILDCLSPVFPPGIIRVSVLAGSASLRALCGVAAGSAKASLSNHFAIARNLGEVAAKDSSQETVVSLSGMLAGTLIIRFATGPLSTWILLLLLLACHLGCNYMAVRSVQMNSLNRQRAGLVFHELRGGKAPTLQDVARQERIFERDGAVRDAYGRIIGWALLGVSMQTLLGVMGRTMNSTAATALKDNALQDLLTNFQDEDFLLWYEADSRTAYIVLKNGCSVESQIRAWWLAILAISNPITKSTKEQSADGKLELRDISTNTPIQHLTALLRDFNEYPEYIAKLKSAGWDLSIPALETVVGSRITISIADR